MIIRDTETLHNEFQQRLERVEDRMREVDFDFRIYETWRSPERQQELYARGRTKPGKKCTNAEAWGSFHQYGLAADFAVLKGGIWTWPPKTDERWLALREIASECGLRTLSSEFPHVEMPCSTPFSGVYPDGGGEGWEDILTNLITGWERFHPHERTRRPVAPPIPTGRPEV